MSQINLLTEASHPEVGSSKYINLDPPIKAIATESLLFYPPERFLERTSVLSTKSTS